jgi:4-hydroxybenzoate polyprenyltransferase
MHPYLRLIRFDKPIGTLLILWPTLCSLMVAYDYTPPIIIVLVFIIEAVLTRSFGCAINDFFDYKFDKLVLRTKDRPISAGLIKPKHAFLFAIILMIVAFIIAIITLKSTTIITSVLVLVFICTYPLTKRLFSIPQLYLGFTWSSGIILSFVQAGTMQQKWFFCLLLCLINISWVIAFDTIYALIDEKYDRLIKIKSSAILFDSMAITTIKVLYYLYMGLLIYLGTLLHMHALYYIVLSIVWLSIFAIFSKIKNKNPNECLIAFLSNNRIGYLTFAAFITEIFYKLPN